MNWNEAEALLATARNPAKGKPIGNNTRLYFREETLLHLEYEGGHESYYIICLHGNQIMRIYRDRIEFADSAWKTNTTKARLNEHLPYGFYVFQKNWEWYIQDMHATNPDDPDKPLIYHFNKVRWIHDDNKVMLYSTHPKYPEVYGDDEE